MKFIRIFLLVLIIIGIGLLATQKVWVPPLVNFLLRSESKKWEVIKIKNVVTAVSTTTKKIIQNNKPTENETFPIPELHPEYSWKLAGDKYGWFDNQTKKFIDAGPLLDVSPLTDAELSKLSSRGAYYVATNTDPYVKKWHEYVNSVTENQDIGFYGGDRDFLNYYDKQLDDMGYGSTRIYLDKNLNMTSTNSGYAVYSILSAGDGDGPIGTSRGYFKYDNGKVRVIIISSDTTENSVFISDILNLRDVIPSN